MSHFLISFDTDRIKDYVFATHRLSEIRGASALLDRLNRVDMPRLAGGTKIYAHGGSGLFLVPADQSGTTIENVQKGYWQATEAATITGVKVKLPEGFNEDSDLRPHWQRLGLKMRLAKDQNPDRLTAATHPFFRPCDSCGVRYATEDYIEPDRSLSLLCRSCYLKRQEDRRIKDEIPKLTSGKLKPQSGRLWHGLIPELKKDNYPFGVLNRPEDFDTLGRQSSPEGYMGLICADGNDMGRKLEEISSLKEMRRFAEAVDQAVYGAVKQAILKHLQPSPKATSLPFDVLLLGGDDLVMATTAQTAIETGVTVVEKFSELTKENYGRALSLCVAIILVHVGFPFHSLVSLAEDALKFAKKVRKKRALQEGLVNFLVVSSPNHLGFEEFYKETLRVQSSGQILYRTLRPYTVAEMGRLIQTKRALSDAPRGRLEQMREAVFKGRHQAMLESLATWVRWRDEAQKRQIWQFVESFSGGTPSIFPWVQRDGDYYTPVLDLVELFDFIP